MKKQYIEIERFNILRAAVYGLFFLLFGVGFPVLGGSLLQNQIDAGWGFIWMGLFITVYLVWELSHDDLYTNRQFYVKTEEVRK